VVDLEPAAVFEVALALPSGRPPKAATQAFLDLLAEMYPVAGIGGPLATRSSRMPASRLQ
jgi:hypothetical protein